MIALGVSAMLAAAGTEVVLRDPSRDTTLVVDATDTVVLALSAPEQSKVSLFRSSGDANDPWIKNATWCRETPFYEAGAWSFPFKSSAPGTKAIEVEITHGGETVATGKVNIIVLANSHSMPLAEGVIGSTFSVRKGEQFRVRLRANVGEGEEWRLAKQGENSPWNVSRGEYEPPQAGPESKTASESFWVRATRSGTRTLQFNKFRHGRYASEWLATINAI